MLNSFPAACLTNRGFVLGVVDDPKNPEFSFISRAIRGCILVAPPYVIDSAQYIRKNEIKLLWRVKTPAY